MINFVRELPKELKPNALYFVLWEPKRAELFVTDRKGSVVEIANKEAITGCMEQLRGESGGIAGLTTAGTLYVENMPEDVAYMKAVNKLLDEKVAELLDGAPEMLDTIRELSKALNDDPEFGANMVKQLAAKANAADVYSKEDVVAFVEDLEVQIAQKQPRFENAEDLAAFGRGTYNGEPLITLSTQEW